MPNRSHTITVAPTLDPVEDITRRRLLTAVPVLALVAAGMSCDDASDGAPTATATPERATRIVDSARGPVEIPVAPQRVVPVDATSSLTLVDVGVEPAGALSDYFTPDYWPGQYVAALGTRPSIGSGGVPEVELVATLDPDLIIGYEEWAEPGVYDRLAAIAPTVVLGQEFVDWKGIARNVADLMGSTSVLEAIERDVDAQAAGIKERHADTLARTRWSIVSAFQDQWYLSLSDAYLPTLLTQAGVQLSSAAAGKTGGVQAYSYEELRLLEDADVILYPVSNDSRTALDGLTPLFEHPLWQSLPAVQAGQLYGSSDLDLQSFGWALAALDRLDQLLTELA